MDFKQYFDVQLHVANENSLYNPLDPTGLTFSGDIYDYIEDCYSEKHFHEVPRLVITADSPIDTERLGKAIRAYIRSERENNDRKRKKFIIQMLRLSLIGVTFLALWIILENTLNPVGVEILSIIGSFSIWEAAAIAIEQMPEIRVKKIQLKQLELLEIIIK